MTLIEQGENIEPTFLPGLPMNTIGENEPVGLADEFFNLEPDVLVLQRPMAEWQLLGLRDAQKHGIVVVVEIDDYLHAVDGRTAFAAEVKAHHLRTFEQCCLEADLVTVSTPFLAERYAPHGRSVVLPNYVPESWLEIDDANLNGTGAHLCHGIQCDHCKTLVGWTGSIGSHVTDLTEARGIGQTLAEHNATFRTWGKGNTQAKSLIKQTLRLQAEPDVQPWNSRDQYPHEIAKLTVGIAPLAGNPFNRLGKSWLKPLEYAACGVPCVMSSTSEYRRLHEHGIGIIATRRSEWQTALTRLLTDHQHHRELAEHSRQAVREHYTMEQHAWRWAEAWLEPTLQAA